MSIVTIIGSGMMGSALSFPLRDNGNTVRLVGSPLDGEIIDEARKTGWHRTLKRQLPEGIEYYRIEEVGKAIEGTDLIVGGVSSFGVDWFARNILPIIPSSVPLLSVTKGMMDEPDGSLISYPEYYQRMIGKKKLCLCAIGGPCTSYELADKDPTEVCFCGPDMRILRKIKSLFETSYYHISLSTDVRGVETAVAMKNAYALAVTLAVGMAEKRDGKQHYNSQAALFGQSMREMEKILAFTGSSPQNLYLGVADLYVTVFGGRTRLIGTLLGKGYPIDKALAELKGVTLESIVIATRTARAVKRRVARGAARKEDFPLLYEVDKVINGKKPVDIPWSEFETEMHA